MTRKLMNNKVEVFARHISFDLMHDYIDNVSFNNQSCEYVLNQLFRNSNFSKHYKGYSDIVNAQNYKMSMANILEAIGGKSGSVIDTFGNGAEILRDNENIHVLNRRGNNNEVTIEYRKNLTGFELEEDTTDLVTRILPYAKYNDEETSEEITVKTDFIDSPLINNYSHPYIKAIDYSEKFEEGEIPTKEKLIIFANNEYKNNKVEIPKQNFKIDFIPLSKCVGYEGLEDKISLCDTVTIIDTRYNIDTKAKVIKTVFNVLKNRYESIELGEPRTSLGDIIGSGGNDEVIVGPPGPQGPPGQDGNLGDFPNSLPNTPVLQSFVYGFSNIELSWSFENKIYYQYELYASKTKDFIPNTFDLIFQGQASSYMLQAKPNETWYFRVCAINTYGERTEFSNQATVTTTKIEDLSNYVENMAIGEALIGELSLDRGWIGKLNANLLDVKGNFSVTDGNGKRTLDIDSFGNVNLDVASLKISSKRAATQDYTNSLVNNAKDEAINNSNEYTDTIKRELSSKIEVTSNKITQEVKEVETTANGALTKASSVEQTANSLTTKVTSIDNKYSELKQTVDGIDITGMVTFRDLAGTGTTINGSNITTGTINGDKVNVTNINASNIKSGTINGNLINVTNLNASNITSGIISGNRISGGVITGSTLKTAEPTSNGGVWIKQNAIQLGGTGLLYEGSTFKIETGGNTSYSSTGSIFLMPGMSGASPTGNGYVNVSGNLSCNRIEGSAINSSGNIYAGGTLGCSSTLTAGNRITSGGEIHAYDGVSKLGYYAYFTPGYCYSLKINNSYLAATGSGFHVFSGGTSAYGYLYTKNVLTGYSLDEALPISENLGSVFNIIDNLEVVENEGLKIKVKEEKTINNNERSPVSITKEGLTQIDNNGMLSTLLKAVQELKQENEEIKKELKILKEKVGA